MILYTNFIKFEIWYEFKARWPITQLSVFQLAIQSYSWKAVDDSFLLVSILLDFNRHKWSENSLKVTVLKIYIFYAIICIHMSCTIIKLSSNFPTAALDCPSESEQSSYWPNNFEPRSNSNIYKVHIFDDQFFLYLKIKIWL